MAIGIPATLTAVGGSGAAAAGGKGTALLAFAGVSVVGNLFEGFAQQQAAKFQAAVLRQQADSARQVAKFEARRISRLNSRRLATIRARRAGSGIIPSTGSALLTDEDFSLEAALAEVAALRGGEIRASRLEAQAILSGFRGKAALTAGFLGAGKSLLQASILNTALTKSGGAFS